MGGRRTVELSGALGSCERVVRNELTALRRLGYVATTKRGRFVTWYIGKRGRKWLVSEIARGRALLFPGVPEK